MLTSIIFSSYLFLIFHKQPKIVQSCHPVHLSVVNIEYKKKNFNVSIRLFVDDFQKIIYQNYKVNLNLGTPQERKDANTYINKYIYSHLNILPDNKKIELKHYKLISREIKDLTIWLNYKIKYPKKFTTVKIVNSLMTDLYRDQKNLLIFTYNSIQKPFEFYYDKTTVTFNVK